MAQERRDVGGTELEIGGFGLFGAALLVVGLCAASFWLGRWSVQTGMATAGGAGAAGAAAVQEEGDVGEELTFFDRLERAPELSAQGDGRPAPAAAGAGRSAAEPAATPPAAGAGPYEIQVLASAERAAAEAVLARLAGRGYEARLVEGVKDGRPIYRVRVGGYATEAEARAAAASLEQQEGLRTWITR